MYKTYAIIAVCLGVLIMVKKSSTPRGIRNNNPGNIRKGENWKGSVGDDGEFIKFKSPEYGLRALGKLLLNYQRLYGINSVGEIIQRYAPSNENNTDSYIEHVAKKLDVKPWQTINIAANLQALVAAIITHENGFNPYDSETIKKGLALV